jgi:hypothetical protein
VADDGLAEAGPAAPDVGDDPPGDGGPGLLVGCFWHAVHDGGGRADPPGRGRPGAAWMKTADETGFPPMLLDATLLVPAWLASLLAVFGPLFTASSFRTFCGLAVARLWWRC